VRVYKPQCIYTADRILQEKDYNVLRLPSMPLWLKSIELIWNLIKQETAAVNVSSVSLAALKEMKWKIFGEINKDQMKPFNHAKTVEQYRRRDGLMEEATEDIIMSI
jgi:hypothetical protein